MDSFSRIVFTPFMWAMLKRAEVLVAAIPNPHETGDVDGPWRCHEVARAVGVHLGLQIVDGWFGAVDHSWLVLENRAPRTTDESTLAILDVYAVASLPQVQIHDASCYARPIEYRPGPMRTDIRDDVAQWMLRHLEGK